MKSVKYYVAAVCERPIQPAPRSVPAPRPPAPRSAPLHRFSPMPAHHSTRFSGRSALFSAPLICSVFDLARPGVAPPLQWTNTAGKNERNLQTVIITAYNYFAVPKV